MATTQEYRGYRIKPMRQWSSWCAEAYPTQADLPLLAQSPLTTLAAKKDAAVAQIKEDIDRVLASYNRWRSSRE